MAMANPNPIFSHLWKFTTSLLFLFFLASTSHPRHAYAAPIIRRQGDAITALSTTEIAAFRPFTNYASSAYCPAAKLRTWSCGRNCLANPAFQPVAAGGDGNDIQFWFVGIDPTLKTVVVAHQGTDPKKIMPILTDIDFILDELDPKLFPGLPKGIKVHNGFGKAHAETSSDVLAAVKSALSQSGLNQVTVVGHSLGGAIALLNGVFLPLNLPDVSVRTVTYGMPRVGNKAFAKYVDANVSIDRVVNREDIVPILPGRFLGFRHPGGEKHIQDDLSWVLCPGGDNTDKWCSVGDARNVFDASVKDHSGPYDTITMGC
ncbi:lipase [Coprinellus micaceus]|uniref:Lipase n=1 Tax=Coprinellus micaceus TaxID=71717 RepID=A0A4Y7TGF6_COPMI|nr:lipase [Coprinellus micaceus]